MESRTIASTKYLVQCGPHLLGRAAGPRRRGKQQTGKQKQQAYTGNSDLSYLWRFTYTRVSHNFLRRAFFYDHLLLSAQCMNLQFLSQHRPPAPEQDRSPLQPVAATSKSKIVVPTPPSKPESPTTRRTKNSRNHHSPPGLNCCNSSQLFRFVEYPASGEIAV